ncbi:MAG: hypothetical protein AAGA69_09155 [Pseudomonadota bacterium]
MSDAAPTIIDLTGSADPVTALDDRLGELSAGQEIVLLLPASCIRSRRFALAMELQKPVSNKDLEDLSLSAADLTGNEEKLAILYRQPAAFTLDHRVTFQPPIGEVADELNAEFLDLSMSLADASAFDALVSRHDHRLVDVVTPHEALAYAHTTEEDEVLLIHIGYSDTVVSVTSEGGLAGTGSLAAGARHLETDLVLAGLCTEEEGPGATLAALRSEEQVGEDLFRVLDARLDEIASFVHHVRSAAHGRASMPTIISGLGASAKRAEDIFTRVLDSRVEMLEQPISLTRGIAEARRAPRMANLASEAGQSGSNTLWRWLRRHI